MASRIEATGATPQPIPIVDVARKMGLPEDYLELYGRYKAKVSLDVLNRSEDRPNGKYIVVTSITPTPLGEGKTTTSIGLAMAMNRIGYCAAVSLRQSSLGPVFGAKGGAAGGGRARLLPFDDVNLHLTGDAHAVSLAHNLLAAFIDNSIYHGNSLDLDPFSITWPRVMDLNDRALRRIVTGLGGKENGLPREGAFDIVAASEVMAILALTTGRNQRAALEDLRCRLGRVVVGATRSGKPLTAQDLHAAGAMAVLLKDALKPNLVQTCEHTPAFVHTGPFGNVAHGSNSIMADQVALKFNDYVISEAGFASDMGMEKFFDIKCRYSGLRPNAVVLVATVRALKMHGGVGRVVTGRPLPEELDKENLGALDRGASNLIKHIENARLFGMPVVVALNRFPSDTDREVARIEQIAREAGAEGTFSSTVHDKGGTGAISLAEAVAHAANKPSSLKLLYPDELPIKDKIERIVTQVYGGAGVDYLPQAESKIKLYTERGYSNMPVCIAKTHLSLSDDPQLKGRPRNFRVLVRDVTAAVGAGFLSPICGEMHMMPGLPSEPAGAAMDLDPEGSVVGLF